MVIGLRWIYGLASFVLWSSFALGCLRLVPHTQEFAQRLVDWSIQLPREFRDVLFEPIARVGKSDISVFNLFQVLIFIVVVFFLAHASRRVLLNQILRQTPLDLGIQHAIATFTQYIVIAFGLLVGLQTAGIDLSALTILAGAVGVGVGLGLQNIANNFISGIIILFERPIKIGDRIEVGAVNGDVVHIAARSTTVRTNDNIAIIIPNSSFISSNVINWSHGDSKVRFRVPVGVAYGSDVRLVERLLLEVAKENENVLENPPAAVRFLEFGDSALEFELRVWSSRLLHRKGLLISQLNFGIYEKFKQHQIEIPFPQRDLHFKAQPEVLRQMIHSASSDQASPEREPVTQG
ncbi:MAG: mechanosensitive ion channel protein MscS [Acidobacteria bacterium]|nr:MAG: mechanosensitive ion channel protein MscS [Acidobacteriota bacterium]